MPLTPEEQLELQSLEQEFGGLTPDEQVELQSLEAEYAQQEPQADYGGFVGGAKALGAGALDMATFGTSDEIKAGIAAGTAGIANKLGMTDLTMGEAYQQALPQLRQEQAQMQEQQGGAYLGGQALGGIGTALAAPAGLTKGISNVASKGFLPAIGTGAGVGAVSGGVYGLGSGQGSGTERLKQGGTGAAFGAGGGVAGVAAGNVLSRVAKPLASRARKAFGKAKSIVSPEDINVPRTPQEAITARNQLATTQAIMPELPDSPIATGKVQKALKQDFGDEYETAIEAYRQGDISLSELYGKRTTSLGQGAAQFPSGKAVAEGFYDPKKAGAYDRALASVGRNISGIDNYYTTADDLLAKGREKASPIYKKAFELNQSIASPRLDRILATPAGKDAVKSVAKNYQNELRMMAKPTPELTALSKELSNMDMMLETKGGVSSGLKLEALDAVKKEIDKSWVRAKKGVTMGQASAGNSFDALDAVRRNLIEEIDNLDGSKLYEKARSEAGEYIRVNNALENGRKSLGLDSELLKKEFSALPAPEKEAFKIGLGKAVRTELSKATDNADPYKRILGSPEKRNKLAAILSPKQYKDLTEDLTAEKWLWEQSGKVIGGSPTSEKQMSRNLIGRTAGAVDNILSVPRKAMVKGIQAMTDGINDRQAQKISEILYETDPKKKVEILKSLNRAREYTKEDATLVKKAYYEIAKVFDSAKAIDKEAITKASSIATGGKLAAPKPLEIDIDVPQEVTYER